MDISSLFFSALNAVFIYLFIYFADIYNNHLLSKNFKCNNNISAVASAGQATKRQRIIWLILLTEMVAERHFMSRHRMLAL